MITINPQLLLRGFWHEGYALDLHTVQSTFTGYTSNVRYTFSTQRTPLGELVYRFKYCDEQSVLDEIVDVTIDYICSSRKLEGKIDLIIPVPASNVSRANQPVAAIAKSVGLRIGIPVVYFNIRDFQ